MYNIYSVLIQSQELLKNAQISTYKLDVEILLCHALNITKTDLIINPDRAISQKQFDEFNLLIEKRLKHHPIAKLIGKKEFYGLDFKVDINVLDPRPDTETLIDTVLKYFPNKESSLSFLDIGTGSGNIAVTLAVLYRNSTLTAIDLSKTALQIAKENADFHNVNDRIIFQNSDLFKVLNPLAGNINRKYDLIISNPPYIETSVINSLDKEVKLYDPILALDGGNDGLHCYRHIAKKASNFLDINGYIVLEIGYNQRVSVAELFKEYGYILCDYIQDLGQNDRCLVFEMQ